MYIIGVSCFYHDSAVCLFKDDELIFACEEERFTGIKHDSSFPYNALEYIWSEYELTPDKVEAVCFYEDPKLKLKRVLTNYMFNPVSSFSFTKDSLTSLYKNTKLMYGEFSKLSNKVYIQSHHHSHLYYSYFSSQFDDAVVVSVDGVGESDTMSVAFVNNGKFNIQPLMKYPRSLGLFYSAMTSFLGFKPNNGEYKLMGLAGFGDPSKYYERVKKLNMAHFEWDRSNTVMFNTRLSRILGIPNRLPEEEITQEHKDVAAATQLVYEEELFDTLNVLTHFTTSKNLCLGGGCAYNGVANGKIKKATPFEQLWIPPAPSDAGSCVGAVLGYLHNNRTEVPRVKENPFLGPEYIVEGTTTNEQLYDIVVDALHQGKVVGWFRGRMEFGARALGNRSILANPFIGGTRDKVNRIVKKREGFRPFAPMVRWDWQSECFEEDDYVPYMNQVVRVKENYRAMLQEVSNVDGTARIQSVKESENPDIYKLLTMFNEKTGLPPILLNTSFNVKGQTMVLTPKMAHDTFNSTDIDLLVINNTVIHK